MTDTAEGIQQELQEYLQKKGINALFINIVESLLLSKPENPIIHIAEYLQTNFPDQLGDYKFVSSSHGNDPKMQTSAPISARSNHNPNHSDDSESEDEEENDHVGEIVESVAPKIQQKGRRTSVSAETIDPSSARQFERVVHPKSDEIRNSISRMVEENILFKSLDENQHQIVLDAMFPKEYEPEETIIRQGDDGDNFYILESGVCEVYKGDVLVQTCTDSMSFGELALMYNAPRAATVKAKEKSKVWALDRQTFKHIIMETTLKRREAHKGFIEQVPLLESLSEYERLTVTDALKTESFSDGEVIISQGDDGNLFYIIESGTAVCSKQISPQDPPVEIGELNAGAYFGEIALLTTRPRQATVTAKGKVVCLTLDRKTFKRVMGPLEDILKRNIDKYNAVIANNI